MSQRESWFGGLMRTDGGVTVSRVMWSAGVGATISRGTGRTTGVTVPEVMGTVTGVTMPEGSGHNRGVGSAWGDSH